MAIIHKGILSFFYDKKYKKKLAHYMGKSSERPSNSKSTRPVTEKQLAQRLKFALAIKFVTAIKLITAIGFKQLKKRGISPTNIALQKLLKKSIIGEYPDLKIDYKSVRISTGNVSLCYDVDLNLADQNTIDMSWVIGNNWREDHRFLYHFIHVLLYDEQGQQELVKLEVARRGDCELSIRLPQYLEGASLHCWIFLSTENYRSVSDSIYVGELIPGIINQIQ